MARPWMWGRPSHQAECCDPVPRGPSPTPRGHPGPPTDWGGVQLQGFNWGSEEVHPGLSPLWLVFREASPYSSPRDTSIHSHIGPKGIPTHSRAIVPLL